MASHPSPSLAPRKRPSQARSRDRVRRILAATRELVEREPIESVTTTAIAERAGLPVGSLYQYFPNRLAILAELARRELREIDDGTVAILEAGADAPWAETVGRVVDGALAAHRGRQGTAPLWRSLAPTTEFRKLSDESNARLAEALARHPALAGCGRPSEEVRRIARVAIEAGDALQKLVLGAASPAEAEAVSAEMKTLLRAYLAEHLDAPARRRDPTTDSRPTETPKERT